MKPRAPIPDLSDGILTAASDLETADLLARLFSQYSSPPSTPPDCLQLPTVTVVERFEFQQLCTTSVLWILSHLPRYKGTSGPLPNRILRETAPSISDSLPAIVWVFLPDRLIPPVLLYNCALWTLSQTLTDVVNVWHRQKLRTIIGITYPQRISNTALYARAEQTTLSQFCRQQRLLWFGHVVREGAESSSFQALQMSINTTDIRRPRGRPRLRWIDVVKKDLKCINLSLLDAVQSASDRAACIGSKLSTDALT